MSCILFKKRIKNRWVLHFLEKFPTHIFPDTDRCLKQQKEQKARRIIGLWQLQQSEKSMNKFLKKTTTAKGKTLTLALHFSALLPILSFDKNWTEKSTKSSHIQSRIQTKKIKQENFKIVIENVRKFNIQLPKESYEEFQLTSVRNHNLLLRWFILLLDHLFPDEFIFSREVWWPNVAIPIPFTVSLLQQDSFR